MKLVRGVEVDVYTGSHNDNLFYKYIIELGRGRVSLPSCKLHRLVL